MRVKNRQVAVEGPNGAAWLNALLDLSIPWKPGLDSDTESFGIFWLLYLDCYGCRQFSPSRMLPRHLIVTGSVFAVDQRVYQTGKESLDHYR